MAFSTNIIPVATTPSDLPPILSAAEFAASTGGRIASDDTRLEPLLAGASAAIRRYCRWHVTPVVDESMILDHDGGPIVALPTLRLIDVTALAIHGTEYTPAELDELKWSHNGEIALPSPGRGMRPGAGFRAIAATIRHGFDDAVDVKQIIQQIVGNAISSPLGATREQAGQVSISWATTAPGVSGGISLLQRDLDILNLYRLP